MGFFDLNQVVLDVPWEKDLKPGPVGEYLEVIDVDPPGGCAYVPVDLNDQACWRRAATGRRRAIRSSISRWSMPWR